MQTFLYFFCVYEKKAVPLHVNLEHRKVQI